jgi:ABC-type enterochelin transport system permease subunit
LQAARALVLGKATGLVGAVFGGIYGGYGLTLLGHLSVETYRAQALRCLFALLAGIALMAAALFLERVLRVPPEQPTPPSSTGDNKLATPRA